MSFIHAGPRKPPSRQRYEAEHPVIAVRVDSATHARLVKLRDESGATLGALVRRALGGVEDEFRVVRDAAWMEGHDEGRAEGWAEAAASLAEWKEAEKQWKARLRELEAQLAGARASQLTFACAGCGQPVVVPGGSQAMAEAAAYLTTQQWGHAACVRQPA